MKKLLFSLAAATSALLLADPINATSFEDLAAGTTGLAGKTDSGVQADAENPSYFLFDGAKDSSTVADHAQGVSFEKRPDYFASATLNRFLSVDTGDGRLYRSVNAVASNEDGSALGEVKAVPDAGLYIDTLVQFTPSEVAPAYQEGKDRLNVWMGIVPNTETPDDDTDTVSKLCVRAGSLALADGNLDLAAAKVYTSDIKLDTKKWYRLTIKAVKNVFTDSTKGSFAAFKIYIDDTLVVFNESVGSSEAIAKVNELESAAATALEEKSLLPSMIKTSTVQAVALQGTGSVDDLVVTTDKPAFLVEAPTEFGGGEGTEAKPYIISTAAHMSELAGKVVKDNGNTFAGKYFRLDADIDMSSVGAFGGIGVYNENDMSKSFSGVFDGNNKTISNLVFLKGKYRGLFNQVNGGTIKNLVIDGVSFADGVDSSYGGAAFVGYATGSARLENLTAKGSQAFVGTHNMAGIAVKVQGNSFVYACTNKLAITTPYTKAAGIVAFTQLSPAYYEDCVNEGTISGTSENANLNKDNGIGGIVGWVRHTITLTNCVNKGDIVVSSSSIYKSGSLMGSVQVINVVAEGCSAQANLKPATTYGGGTASGLAYAQVVDGVAYFTDKLVAGGKYKVMLDVPESETPVFTLAAAGDTITFDTSLASFAGTIAAAEGLSVNSAVSADGITYIAVVNKPTVQPGSAVTDIEAETAEDAIEQTGDIVIADEDAAEAGQAEVLKKVAEQDTTTGKWTVYVAIDDTKIVDKEVTVKELGKQLSSFLSSSATTMTIDATKVTRGLYYSSAVATDVNGTYVEGTRVLATGGAITIPVAKPEGKGFIKIYINMTK
jgi:hypothetical protein